jgi:hypothetical protein
VGILSGKSVAVNENGIWVLVQFEINKLLASHPVQSASASRGAGLTGKVVRSVPGGALAGLDDKSQDGSNSECPYCGHSMKPGFFLVGGDVVFAESTVALGPMFASKPDIERMLDIEETNIPFCDRRR